MRIIIASCRLWRRSKVRIGVIIALMTISTVAFAADARKQANVYDDFRGWMKPSSPETAVDEEVTATIKRHMANLLYPVDMSSFKGPDSDTNFRDLIKVLQQQMGVSPTGVLTVEQVDRLAEASRYLDGEWIGFTPGKIVWSGSSMVGASGTGAMAGTEPLNFVRILCFKERGTCEMYDVSFQQEQRFLFLNTPAEYQIDVWTPSRVTARMDGPCSTALMTIDIKGEQVSIVTVPQPDELLCKRASREGPSTWKLVDGGPVAWKLGQDKMNKARMLVYPPAKRLMPIQK